MYSYYIRGKLKKNVIQVNDGDVKMKKEWKRISFFLMTIMLASTLSGCIGEKEETPAPTTPAPVEDIKIGCIWPLTGDLAAYGAANKRALELAVEIINNKYPDLNLPLAASEGLPNLGGAKIKLIWGDSRGTPEEGRSAAEYLIINEEVVALLGCYQSAVTETASLPAETYGVPFLNPDSSSPTLTERGYKWFWRCTPKAIDWTRNALEFYTDINEKFDANLHTYGIFNEDTLWGVESGDWLEYWADEFGFEVIERVQYPHETPDLSAEVLRMKQANPDLVHIAGYISDSILYVKTMKENNWLPKMVMSGEMIQMSDFLDALGDDGNYFCLTILFPQDLVTTKALTVKLNEMMDERYGKTFDDPSARAFTGLFVLADAINRAGSTDPAKINAAFAETNIPGEKMILPWAAIQFDEKHQLKAGGYVIQQIQDGEYYTVWPWELATRDIIWPMPSWDER